MRMAVYRGITVSWHDNLLFQCVTELFSPRHRALQTAHTLSLSAFSLFLPLLRVTPTDSPSHRPPPPLSRAGVSQCENLIMFCYWTCKLNWTESYSPGLSQRACIVFLREVGCTCVHALFVCMRRYLYVWSVVNKSGRAPSVWQCPGGEIFPFPEH